MILKTTRSTLRPTRLFAPLSAGLQSCRPVRIDPQTLAHRPSMLRRHSTPTKALTHRQSTQAVRKRIWLHRPTLRRMQDMDRSCRCLTQHINQNPPDRSMKSTRSKPRCMRTILLSVKSREPSMTQHKRNIPNILMLRSRTLTMESSTQRKRIAGTRTEMHDIAVCGGLNLTTFCRQRILPMMAYTRITSLMFLYARTRRKDI